MKPSSSLYPKPWLGEKDFNENGRGGAGEINGAGANRSSWGSGNDANSYPRNTFGHLMLTAAKTHYRIMNAHGKAKVFS